MNSRSSVNESNLVNFSADLSTINQLDTKDGLLSFSFDHIYACHAEGSERGGRQPLTLEKEVEVSTSALLEPSQAQSQPQPQPKDQGGKSDSELSQLKERLTASEAHNKKLKDLLIYHLDLIQQQNDLMTKKDKLYATLKQENETLKSRLSRMDRRVAVSQRNSVNPLPYVHVPASGVTSTVVKSEPGTASQIMLNSYTELLLPDNRTNPYIFDNETNKPKPYRQDPFSLTRPAETDVSSFLSSDLSGPTVLDRNLSREKYTMIENKRSFVKKEVKTEPHPEPLYTITSSSGNPVIHRIQRNRRKTSTGIGSLSRMSRSPAVKEENKEDLDRSFTLNKKSKMINTYGKSKSNNYKKLNQFGSLSERLQLIDTTPTGEDPYQLGEADMREQSPIPKLMLQKTNHGRMKICTDTSADHSRFYTSSTSESNNKPTTKIKLGKYNLPNPYVHPSELKSDSPKTLMVDEPDLDIVKTEPEIDWPIYNSNKQGNETSLCDFSYGETTNNLTGHMLPSLDLQDLFPTDPSLGLDNLNTLDYSSSPVKSGSSKTKRRGRTSSLMGSNFLGDSADSKRANDNNKRGRKRALSTTGLLKSIKRENTPKAAAAAPKPKLVKGKVVSSAACRGKKSPVPGMVTKTPYHTLVGDPDLSWYLGLDPDVKLEDIDPASDAHVSTVEVPRWREKPHTSCYTLEGTENLDDKVFEKRHQKLEAEERRQLRWHMRRIREQRQVERLRQRQRDSWCGGFPSSSSQPGAFTVWPQPQRDLRFIEITDVLPVMAFGEIVPAIPETEFILPWVKTSKALKRSKRSKTLH